VKVSFIGLGAQKCASTWLHRVLAAHPEISMPAEKELNFFSHRFDHGYQWYERQFPKSGPAWCAGEVSPSYFHDRSVAPRASAYHPEIKVMVTLRDPVERAISNHCHEVRMGHLSGPDLSFEAGLANNPMYVEQSLYAKHLANWLSYFPRSRMWVALVDDIRADSVGVARCAFRFLGVDDSVVPEGVNRQYNVGHTNRWNGLGMLKDHTYRMTRRRGLSWLWSAAMGIGARDLYRRVNIVPGDQGIPPVCPETIVRLNALFADDVRRLEALLGRDLSCWQRGTEDRLQGDGVYGGGI
jgi:hypothetical protein